jgi:hypothetical protein
VRELRPDKVGASVLEVAERPALGDSQEVHCRVEGARFDVG